MDSQITVWATSGGLPILRIGEARAASRWASGPAASRWWVRIGAGRDDVDPDALVGVVEGGHFGQADDPGLAGHVRGQARHPDHPGQGGHVHDRAASGLQHGADLVLHSEERAPDVRGDPPVELRRVDLGQRRGHRPVGRVVERRVETTVGVQGGLHEGAYRIGV